MVFVIFRVRLREDVDLAALGDIHTRAVEAVQQIPGFVRVREYAAEDGEFLTIAEFTSREAIEIWRSDPTHLRAKALGKQVFFREYSVHITEE